MSSRAGATQDEVRRHNLSTVLRHLHVNGATSRADLTALMGLNRSTIGGLTAELAAAGLVTDHTPEDVRLLARRSAGRPSYVVAPCVERAQVLALDLRVGVVEIARVGLGGQVLSRRKVPLPSGPLPLDDVLDVVVAQAQELLAELAGTPGVECIALGGSVPGVLRRSDGFVRNAPNLGWIDEPFGRRLSERLGLRVVLGNDADLGVLAEHMRGAAVGLDDVVFLAGQVGVGGGIITGGRRLLGHGGYAGEVGHLLVNPDGRECRCGARGCWETEVGRDAFLRAAGRPSGGRPEDLAALVGAARAGDAVAIGALRHVGRWLGLGSTILVNLLNPSMIVYGGMLADVLTLAGDDVRAGLEESSMVALLEQVQLVAPALGEDSILLGAAELAYSALLDDPIAVMAHRSDSRA